MIEEAPAREPRLFTAEWKLEEALIEYFRAWTVEDDMVPVAVDRTFKFLEENLV